MEDFNKEEIKDRLCNLVDKAAEFSKTEDYEKLKQMMLGFRDKNYEDLSEEERGSFTKIVDKIPEDNLWAVLLLMMVNPFGINRVNIPSYTSTYIPEACKTCSNHPSNGGDGICNCTLGSIPVTYSTLSDTPATC